MDAIQARENPRENYPKQYLDALDAAINELNEDLYEYRDEMRI